MEDKKNQSAGNENTAAPKVTGIGGIFFFSENPKEIKEWYGKT